ncbi:MAG TPA: serine protease [Thermoanaerobaculia bacterium]|nr:serine protease [Thermoanaerobaculia bacterium]
MQARFLRFMMAGAALALLVAASPAEAQRRIKVGDELPYFSATPKAYPRGAADRPVVWSERVVSSGATFVRVHFSRFNLPDGDYVTVSSPDGTDFWTYTGKGPHGTGELWAFMVEGDTAVVELHAGNAPIKGRRAGFGFSIDRIAHGTEPMDLDPAEKIICGTNGSQNAVCQPGINMNPVARLSFQSGGSSFVCTGWLVAGSNANTMLTNNHCVDNQTEVSTVQARFNYQTTTCTGTTQATFSSYAGGTFLRTSTGLDYTIFTLQGNPEATWGEYTATSKQPTTGMAINFPQHPGGGLKKIAYWKDSAQTLRCDVSTVNATYGGSTSGSQMGYSCDSEGGSSGSPIMDAGTGRIIGLHHFGGVGGSTCLNSATQMRQVCSNAGTLLTCATN